MNKLDERFWYGVAAVLAYVEMDAVRNKRENGTLSYAARKAGRCNTRPGRIAVCAGWGALTVWLLPHLCRAAETSICPEDS